MNAAQGHAHRAWRRLGWVLLWPGLAATPWPAAAAKALAPAVSPAAAASAEASDVVEVWVDLSVPALATLPRTARGQRQALRQRIVHQQDAVMAQLAALGGHELGRVQQLRNAVAVRLPKAVLDEARRIPGVQRVRVVRDRQTDAP
jgi:hypothetical protein